ncbi:calmodulin-regulated spectrin-associated protein 1-B isoform X1 [Astyanax mexicanus]|uniref:Calmodulin-regulated spectrin-associated protein 1-B isoform X1 n=2 Tax=Astyanax mexicanus TaxID=7994 RepID=A0A8T2L4E0_ASTMX|nr:calmodulin-regulated spectrin-associated protein 1-B isoform X1 [Astyanax mexicanus]
MDVGATGGGDGGPRRADSVEGGLEIVPLELYDSARAKIDANLRWLFAKAYGEDHVPADLRDPFYTDQYCVEHIKPPVLTLLLSAELYCRVCVLLLKGDQTSSLSSHQSVIQALARRGIYAREPDDTPVTHDDLSSTPIKMSSHIPLIDALMLACSVEMMSIERVVSSVKRFSTFSASKELPFDMEDAMLFWINKVILKTREISEKELKLKQHLMESPCHQKPDFMHALAHCMLEPLELSRVVRYRRDHLSGRCLPHLPLVEDLMKDVCDGAALLAVIHYYCPDYMRLEDICLKEVLSISDSVYNVQLLREFSNEYLNGCLYLQAEDLLYAPPVLKHNVMVYIAELFWWFEVVRPDFVKPRDPQDIKDARPSMQTKSSRPHVPISNATKRSFLSTSPSVDSMVAGSSHDTYIRYYLHPEESASTSVAKVSPSHSPSHQLLPLRPRQQKPAQEEETAEFRNRSSSLSRMDGHSPGSRLAWMERRQRPLSQMEMEWERLCGDNISLARSISKDSLASNVISITPRHQVNGQSVPHVACAHDIEDQEEELVAVLGSGSMATFRDPRPESFFLEPLQPAVLRPNKEKSAPVSKRDESGEGRGQRRRGVHTPTEHTAINQTFTTVSAVGAVDSEDAPQSGGFFLHSKSECVRSSPVDIWVGKTSDSEFEEEEVDEVEGDDLEDQGFRKARLRNMLGHGKEEEESSKLHEEVRMREREDKEGASGRSSPCPSTLSQASSTSTGAGHTRHSSPCRSTLSQVSSASSRMTSFAERRMHRAGTPDDYYSSCSSQTTTPDGSECAPFPPVTSDTVSPSPKSRGGVASELVHLRMQLEEKRRAIETQKKKMETLSARQRLKLGKAAFLHVVKKGRGDTLPRPFKQDLTKEKEKETAKDDSCVEALKTRGKEVESSLGKESRQWGEISSMSPAGLEGDNRASEGEEMGGELDLGECSRSIELLNDAIGAIQQQMVQLSVQQDLLMRQTALSPTQEKTTQDKPTQEKPQTPSEQEPKPRPSVQFVEISTATRRPPKLSSGRTPRTKPSELKLSKSTKTINIDPRPSPISRTPRSENEDEGVFKEGGDKINGRSSARGLARNATFRLHDACNRRADGPESPKAEPPTVEPTEAELARERSGSGGSGKENIPVPSEESRAKAQLIEVDLSDLANPDSGTEAEGEGEQKSGLGFFFKDDQKAADELAKKRAAFLLKQQKKAEEARLRKQQLEAESELKRDEARRKAEEERVRKEEEKARRELIKQEYLRRKQQELLEEQGVAKPRPRHRKPRPKSVHRRESGNSTPVGLCTAPSGSSLSLASAATEGDSVTSGGGSQRGESVESFPMLSRNASRNMERDWDNGSTASSITSVAEYNGPRLFKEPSAKSNKPIIQNAIAHCCLAGKVNEAQKNAILEEIERCESNHLMILFRDGGCQFRALYTFALDTEEILKLAGTGPRAITRKMIDKLFKYSSDRKQFTVIPAKTVSASVDAITIHNHLWQVKRPGSSKRK